jgi:AAA+ superfamily predicted ATPase
MTEKNASWPSWAEELRQAYVAGTASMFILNGNVSDLVGSEENGEYRIEPLADFLAQKLFGSYDLVLHYDMGRGLRAFAGSDPQRLMRMNALLGRLQGDKEDLPRDPTQALRVIDRLVSLVLVGEENRQRKTAILFDYAETLCPPDDRSGEHLATLLNWARSPVIRRVNLIFVLMTESLSRLHPSLTQSGHTHEVFLPLPSESERRTFIARQFPAYEGDASRLAVLSSGITCTNLDSMMRRVVLETSGAQPQESSKGDSASIVKREGSELRAGAAGNMHRAVDDARLLEIKKSLMEAQCPGLFEFVRPGYSLTMVAGHTAAKERLTNDAKLLKEGHLDAVPMGYLVCGPVGVGKTFLALCYAGEVGIPCLTIRNFRSKYVGETEANMERILSVVRELGPIAVIIDEADAAVGDRTASGDSGTSARVFAQLASQMGDTRYRGRIVWFLLTCRPDLLPIDLKRQGRCEEHIPLFYPQTPDEIKEMFMAMARKAKVELDKSNLPDFGEMPSLSGADIEGILMRAHRDSILRQKPVDLAIIEEVIKGFRSAKSAEHELQELAGILECTDVSYLPTGLRADFTDPAKYEGLVLHFRKLKAFEAAEGL